MTKVVYFMKNKIIIKKKTKGYDVFFAFYVLYQLNF